MRGTHEPFAAHRCLAWALGVCGSLQEGFRNLGFRALGFRGSGVWGFGGWDLGLGIEEGPGSFRISYRLGRFTV